MTAKDFIIEQIEQIALQFPFLSYDYYQDEISDAHFVQVSPNEYFERYVEEFTLLQNTVVLKFIEKYPLEIFAFIGEEEILEGESPVYSLKGSAYSESAELCWSGEEIENLFNNFKPEFKEGFYSFKSSIILEQSKTEIMIDFDINFTGKSTVNKGDQKLNSNIDKTAISDSVSYSEFGEDNYLLAT